jgi:hypothetical protein
VDVRHYHLLGVGYSLLVDVEAARLYDSESVFLRFEAAYFQRNI